MRTPTIFVLTLLGALPPAAPPAGAHARRDLA